MHFHYMSHIIWHIVEHRDYHDDLNIAFSNKMTEEEVKLVAHLSIESDERIIDYEHARLLDKILEELVSAHFATRQQHHALVKQRPHHESIEQRIRKELAIVFGPRITSLFDGQAMSGSTRFIGRQTCGTHLARSQSPLEHGAHQWRLVAVLTIEALLEIIWLLDRT